MMSGGVAAWHVIEELPGSKVCPTTLEVTPGEYDSVQSQRQRVRLPLAHVKQVALRLASES